MGWLLLAALAIMWAAFLLPAWGGSQDRSMKEFERNMDMLAETGERGQGRWIVTPRKGTSFMGRRARAQARARERRRRVLMVLVECVALTGLIGLFPPLRAMWYATAGLVALLGAYVWALLALKSRGALAGDRSPSYDHAPPAVSRPARQRYASDASNRIARPAFNGLPALGDDMVNIVVRPAAEVGVARV